MYVCGTLTEKTQEIFTIISLALRFRFRNFPFLLLNELAGYPVYDPLALRDEFKGLSRLKEDQ